MIEPLHETIIRDIIDIAQDVKDSDEVDMILNRQNGRSFGSITSKSKGLIMVFPVICSNYMSYESAMLIAKATERKATILLSLLFQASCITDVDSAEEFIKQFHTNLPGRMTMDDFGDMMDRFAESDNMIEVIKNEYSRLILAEMSQLDFYFEDTLSENSISDYRFSKTTLGETTILEPISEAPMNLGLSANDAKAAKDMADFMLKDKQMGERILNTEIRKANELAPTLLYVNFITKEEKIYSSAVVGVKAKLYIVDGEDIMNRLTLKHADKNHLLNLVRLGSGEISFFRDFLFAIDRAKIDAISQSRRGSSSKMWKVLERRAIKSKVRRSLSMVNDATAITTLAITQDEVEYLKKSRYIDVEDPRIITRIMDAYNLMGFTIVDESMEVCKFLYDDGEGHYEVITFDGLEREQRDNTKKIVNLMSKMSR